MAPVCLGRGDADYKVWEVLWILVPLFLLLSLPTHRELSSAVLNLHRRQRQSLPTYKSSPKPNRRFTMRFFAVVLALAAAAIAAPVPVAEPQVPDATTTPDGGVSANAYCANPWTCGSW
ncbi:SubName: Full=Uncharacterized protein {ECO:0000313/EMBL:CCA75500.1} [Serendipita indica DSM 11827]|nr:SubName: Full=Uncharacterized protein {ECO:0000313/EMBL:CCA75500.1} [Serendipita indica DSM 11827]